DEIKKIGFEQTENLHENVIQQTNLETLKETEKEISIKLEDNINDDISILKGYIDIVEDNKIRELKTSARRWSDNDLNKNRFQHIIYAYAIIQNENKEQIDIQYDVLIHTGKNRNYQNFLITFLKQNEQEIQELLNNIKYVKDNIKKGNFPKLGIYNYACSYCGYKHLCKINL
ncbi:MAG: PD-(D/E)XK nuclease family protein, partial [Candidatus Aenigmatarchaeota archaeon]